MPKEMACSLAILAVLLVSTLPVYSLKCNEGFNGTLGGIPFFHWAERECSKNSECFIQELETKILNTELEFVIRYGACTSRPYAPLLSCENLFGAKSNLDPAVVFNMMPDLDKIFNDIVNDFYADHIKQNRLLFSGGKGMEEFIEGIMKFFETMGLNMEKVKPLTEPITQYFRLSFGPGASDFSSWEENVQHAQNEILDALGKLDTKNIEISSNLYGFIGNFISRNAIEQLKKSNLAPLVENLPGLIKSAIPKSWDPDTWYDTIFQLLGDVKFESPKKSIHDAMTTLKSAVNVPEKYEKFVDAAFDTVSVLLQQMISENYTYGVTNKLTPDVSPSDITSPFELFPWLVLIYGSETYKSLPGESKYIIDQTYNALSEGLESLNFSNADSTLQGTKMSDFFISIVDKMLLTFSHPSPTGIRSDLTKKSRDRFIRNFSRIFYNVLTSKYAGKLDTFFETFDKEFQNFPNHYDIGKIISKLITNLGGTVPKEIKPLLDNVQDLVDVFTLQSPKRDYSRKNLDLSERFYEESVKIIRAYKATFPESKYPDLVRRTIYLILWSRKEFPKWDDRRCWPKNYSSLTWHENWEACYNEVLEKHQIKFNEYRNELFKKEIDLSVDIIFAFFNDFDEFFKSAESAFIDVFPAYGTFARLMKVLDPIDVKELINDFIVWYNSTRNRPMSTVDSFVNAFNVTLSKITSKLGNATKELRNTFAPDSCKYLSCGDDFCNSPAEIIKVEPVTKTVTATPASHKGLYQDYKEGKQKEAVTASDEETTSGSEKNSSGILMTIGAMFLIFKSMQ